MGEEKIGMVGGQRALEAKFIDNVFMIFDHIPIGLNFVDENGYVVRLNQYMLDYFNLTHAVEGKHISEVEPSSRLPVVLKTLKGEIAHRHRFSNGREAIVHRIPVLDNGRLVGAIGILLFGDPEQEIYILAEKVKLLRNQLAAYEKSRNPYRTKYTLADILGSGPATRACREQAARVARSNSNVLITGESGVGKELFAHAIHAESGRRDGPFVRVNCAAIPEALLEAELFGYEEGSFTGAKKGGQPGKFELANGGTLFLDEIGDMPYMMQAKILRVLQEREFERVGGKGMVEVNVRVIAATNADLDKLIASGAFRSDLFYRLNVLSLKIPPLKERREDIAGLVYFFQGVINQESGIYANISPACLEVLAKYDWPGNIRELRNAVEKIALEAEGRVAQVSDIPQYILRQLGRQQAKPRGGASLVAILEEVEAEEIRRALAACGGHKIRAAEYLQIPKVRLYRKLRKYNIV